LLLVDVVDGAGLGITLVIVPPENAASPIVNVTDRVRRRYSIASAPQGIAKGRLSEESAVLNLGAVVESDFPLSHKGQRSRRRFPLGHDVPAGAEFAVRHATGQSLRERAAVGGTAAEALSQEFHSQRARDDHCRWIKVDRRRKLELRRQ
jgi:hypothetical protein